MHQCRITFHTCRFHTDFYHLWICRDILCFITFFRQEKIHCTTVDKAQSYSLKMLCFIQICHNIIVHHRNRLIPWYPMKYSIICLLLWEFLIPRCLVINGWNKCQHRFWLKFQFFCILFKQSSRMLISPFLKFQIHWFRAHLTAVRWSMILCWQPF